MSGKIRHLLSRQGRFYARLSVPEALRSRIGKRELLEPIGADRIKAIRALPAAVARMQATIEAAREEVKAGQPTLPARHGRQLSLGEMAQDHYASTIRFDEECRNSDHRYAQGFGDDDEVTALKRCISGAATDQEMQAAVGIILRYFMVRGNLNTEYGSVSWREAARAFAVAKLESLRRTAERDEGNFTGKPDHPLLTERPKAVDPKDALSVRILGPDSTKTLRELLPDFLKERGATDRTDYDSQVTVRMFEEALEEARPVYRITRADLMMFKRALSETPSNYTKRFHGMKLPDAIKANKARNTPFPPLHSKTINGKYLAKLHSLLNWCVRNDILPDNPATGVKVVAVKDKGKPPVVPFTPDDLSRIFDPDLFKAPKVDWEAEWAALISLFSGLRASELAQLKLDSVRHNQDILVFEVEEETKNAGSLRVVPVHSFLIGRGIEKLVADLRRKKQTHLFPQWYRDGMETRANALKKGESTLNHYFPRFIPRRFNNTYLPNAGVQDSRKKWHSFRHTFKTGLARAGVVRSVRDDLCGHVDNSAGAGYVHETSVAVMKAAIEKLKFDGFVLTC